MKILVQLIFSDDQDKIITRGFYNSNTNKSAMASTSREQNLAQQCQNFNSNNYATRKTITQVFLDIALLITNISQLKSVLDAGKDQQFYILLVGLLFASITLQVVQGFVYFVLGSLYNISTPTNQIGAIVWNNVALSLGVLTTVVNIAIGVFEIHPVNASLQVT